MTNVPEVVLFDVFETLLRLEPLRARLIDVGRPAHELELFFARTLRDGMAYTLYTDGSIEAELPQGTMRFSSIEDLRAHLENTERPA